MTENPRLFVVRKPMFISSNRYLSRIKRRLGVKKAGFSGTLDPFACGCLIVATGAYTKLFRFLKKTPKTYRATLWLGACSDTLDIEGVTHIDLVQPVDMPTLVSLMQALQGQFTYVPPKFCAKRVNGRRAYDLARQAIDFDLQTQTSTIHSLRLLHYRHPFVTFEAVVDGGTYIRSIAERLVRELGCCGSLSFLERLNEGCFLWNRELPIHPPDVIDAPVNVYRGAPEDMALGRKLDPADFVRRDAGIYMVVLDDFFAMIEIKDQKVHYLLNKVPLCSS